jgi:hypothetical protein
LAEATTIGAEVCDVARCDRDAVAWPSGIDSGGPRVFRRGRLGKEQQPTTSIPGVAEGKRYRKPGFGHHCTDKGEGKDRREQEAHRSS